MQWNVVKQSIQHLSRSTVSIFCGCCATFFLLFLWRWMTDIALSSANLWSTVFSLHLALYLVFCFLFGVFVAATTFKIIYFSSYEKKHTAVGAFWWFLWILVAWCPACALSLASYMWLASVVALLPRHGLELKIVWVILVGYATWKALVTMEVCSLDHSR